MRTADFNYTLPPELIAQKPVTKRDESRLLVVDRSNSAVSHKRFVDLFDYIRAGDVLVLNNSQVFSARLRGVNAKTGGKFEVLLLTGNRINEWWTMMRPGKRATVGTEIQLLQLDGKKVAISAVVTAVNDEGHRKLHFSGTPDIFNELEALGEIPLPPYIERLELRAEDRERYQTVYASRTEGTGSVAAPTAGLHFTTELLERIESRGAEIHYVTLHVGLGTFAPVKSGTLSEHVMHEERFELSEETARAVNKAKDEKRRVIAVGTTSVRVLESVARRNSGALRATKDVTDIFIFPPYEFQIVDALVTNFHLPCSTLLMLVSAFAAPGKPTGRKLILDAYEKAIEERYRFFSYGDAMLIA